MLLSEPSASLQNWMAVVVGHLNEIEGSRWRVVWSMNRQSIWEMGRGSRQLAWTEKKEAG